MAMGTVCGHEARGCWSPCLPACSALSSYHFTPLQTGANPISMV